MVFQVVFFAMRSISAINAPNSKSSASLSVSEYVPDADCTANSRMRMSILLISSVAPSATSSIEIASFAFLDAIVNPLTTAFMRDEIASPAASSLAELIRCPVESRSIAVDICLSLRPSAFAAIVDEILVFITVIG